MIPRSLKTASLAGVTAIVLAGAAHAAPIISVSAIGGDRDASKANAEAAEDAFLASLHASSIWTQNFDGETASTGLADGGDARQFTYKDFGVATFSFDEAGTGGACNDELYKCDDGMAILNLSTDGDGNRISSPFKGRFPMPEGESNNWLDSMDAQALTITPAEGYNAIGFYITDPNDQGGRMVIGGEDGDVYDFGYLFGNNSVPNAYAFYVSIIDYNGLSPITLYSNDGNDGYGIDNVTVGRVPEPGTMALLALGIAGLGAARRRQKVA